MINNGIIATIPTTINKWFGQLTMLSMGAAIFVPIVVEMFDIAI